MKECWDWTFSHFVHSILETLGMVPPTHEKLLAEKVGEKSYNSNLSRFEIKKNNEMSTEYLNGLAVT